MRLLPLLLASTALAWNSDIHNQIGFIASTLLTPPTTALLPHLLPPTYNASIGPAASWADSFRATPEGRFSAGWHFIDTLDSPPLKCEVHASNCAASGCVIEAIATQTRVLTSCIADVRAGRLRGGSNETCNRALMWVVHFAGDVTQPLHASGRGQGGNTVMVPWKGAVVRLHEVWDKLIPYSLAGVTSFPSTSLAPWSAALAARIATSPNSFLEPVKGWTACVTPATAAQCALEWARESNAWACKYVYAQLVNGTDVSGSYAVGAGPVVEMQIGKAAVRLAAWLNALAAPVGTTAEEGERGEPHLALEL
ncbi:nuclease PA3 [Trichodelitschia bisporula]|uniref:Nuclease PA3 n=1 Tax=Trichodelitschia bisporula TaxID=703511 RepID=A0A6G1I112_9PEZI|nr:nuclease PA3 [Trichodelitschia bisporula]